ncbi:MAG: hypothetical protein ABI376_07095 [Caulobacteraceae bacterium]
MKQIDLDDLPPRVAQTLSALEAGESLALVQGGLVVARLTVDKAAAPSAEAADSPPEERMREIMEQFNAMIHDEF